MEMNKKNICIQSILIVGVIVVVSSSNYVDHNNCKSANKALRSTLLSLDKATDFLLRNQNHLLFDTAGSVAMSQGYLIKVIRKFRTIFPLNYKDDILYRKLFQILQKHRKIIRQCKKIKTDSFAVMRNFFSKPWIYAPEIIRSNLGLVYQPQAFSTVSLRAKIEDCLDEVFEGKHCKQGISKSCWDMLLRRPAEGGYALTAHLALYFIAADMNGCSKYLIKLSGEQSVMSEKQEFFVANMYSQALTLFNDREMLRDPFMEHVLFGIMLGGVDFYKLDWLELVTSWQSDCGCWKEQDYHYTIKPYQCLAILETTRNDTNDQLWKTVHGFTTIEECCNMHETGLGLTNAAAHIDWLLFPPPYSDLGMRSLLGDNCIIRSSQYGIN